ncbi:MAG: type I-E CRISPR-associated protein Cas6/Cse3/CasE [Bradymonadales bacterium]|jgi:CRISPR system Cascade subunit CasE
MYLSRIPLNTRLRNTMAALASPNIIHGCVEDALDRQDSRTLWRIDKLQGNSYLLILSQEKPNLLHIAAQFGDKGEPGLCRPYDKFVSSLEQGQRCLFRLTANPIYSQPSNTRDRGRVSACVTVARQRDWLLKRAEAAGFELAPEAFEVVDRQWKRFYRSASKERGKQVTLSTASYEGELRITDVEAFRRVLCEGLGRARAYGCGLLTVIKL